VYAVGIVRFRQRAWRLEIASLVLAAASIGWSPSGSESDTKVTEEQLEYSKQLYAEGEEAMKAGDHGLALEKFREGYRYAPHLHVFTYNIASAADAMGDCRTAQGYFQMFVDLVEEHPKRREVKKRLEVLREECQYDAETAQLNTATETEAPTSGSRASKEEREAIRSMNEALRELDEATARYEQAKAKHAKIKAFARAARRKAKHAKQLRKAALEAGVELETREAESIEVAAAAPQACREGKSQEGRIIDAIAQVIERFDDPKIYKVARRILRGAERRDRRSFDACS